MELVLKIVMPILSIAGNFAGIYILWKILEQFFIMSKRINNINEDIGSMRSYLIEIKQEINENQIKNKDWNERTFNYIKDNQRD